MAQSTSYDLPNYIGHLFLKGERPNALLKLAGGLNGVQTVAATTFPMGVDYTLTAPSQPSILEGAAATASQTSTSQSSNVVQIFQEAVDLTYSKQAASGAISGVAVMPTSGKPLNVPGSLEWQIARKMEKIAQDVNYSFLRGTYQSPANNATARRTRGVRTAVTTNLFANGGVPRAITKAILETALKDAMENGMFVLGSRLTLMADADQFSAVIAEFESSTQQPISREEAGVSLRTIHTKWAILDLTWEPDMASGEVFITRPEKIKPVAMPIPGKGVLFVEPLAKTGSADQAQVYGELGVDYEHEVFHAVIDDLS